MITHAVHYGSLCAGSSKSGLWRSQRKTAEVSVGLEDAHLIIAAFKHALTFAGATRSSSASVNGHSAVRSTV